MKFRSQMRKRVRYNVKKAGLPPGTLVHVGERKLEKVRITIIATIFIPLTFIAGIYGMNFNPKVSPWNMPELNWRYGYAAVWLIMLVVAGLMILYFKRKKWL